MSESLTERDLRALLRVPEEGRRDDEPTDGLPWATFDELFKLVRCDWVDFPEGDLVHGRGLFCQWLDENGRGQELDDRDDPCPDGYWDCLRRFLPCTYAGRTGDFATVVRWSDFYSDRELREQSLYAEFFRREGTTHGMHASVPARPAYLRKFSFWRVGGPDFTERDRLVVELIRPHLWELYLATQRRMNKVPTLTPREWEVLHLVHEGYGNKAIAQTLFISTATVRKHLEHIYDRTGVRTRGAAAALMVPHHEADRFAP